MTRKKLNEQELRSIIQKGSQAQTFLDNPIFNEVLISLSTKFYSEWQKSEEPDIQARERLFLKGLLLKDMRQELIAFTNAGKSANLELSKLSSDNQ